jgi:hypothetical protein
MVVVSELTTTGIAIGVVLQIRKEKEEKVGNSYLLLLTIILHM